MSLNPQLLKSLTKPVTCEDGRYTLHLMPFTGVRYEIIRTRLQEELMYWSSDADHFVAFEYYVIDATVHEPSPETAGLRLYLDQRTNSELSMPDRFELFGGTIAPGVILAMYEALNTLFPEVNVNDPKDDAPSMTTPAEPDANVTNG